MVRNILILFPVLGIMGTSCLQETFDEGFYPVENKSIAGYLEEKKDSLNQFYSLLSGLNLIPPLTAYNPAGDGYTLFLPSDAAFEEFFGTSDRYGSMEELLASPEEAESFALYHILTSGIVTTDFPFGSLPDTTASGDYLTIAIDTATSEPLINGIARINEANIELTNGYVHTIDKVLVPITYPVSEWITGQENYRVFSEALTLTGLWGVLAGGDYHTLLAETDEVFRLDGILDARELAERVSPGETDYTHPENGLYRFVAFHILEGVYYLDDFEGSDRLYNTRTIYPVDIDGESLVIKINEGVAVFDTLISGQDTTLIDYIGFNYDRSNNQAVNGAVHSIDQVMELFLPGRTQVINQFFNEPVINAIRNDPGETVFRDTSEFTYMKWNGTEELIYVKSEEAINGVWNNDYITLEGSFTFTYEIPRVLPGRYNLYIAAHALDDDNASIQLLFDGQGIGGNLDLTSGGTSNNPYFNFFVATLDFTDYSAHEIEINTLIPGILNLDRITLEPIEE